MLVGLNSEFLSLLGTGASGFTVVQRNCSSSEIKLVTPVVRIPPSGCNIPNRVSNAHQQPRSSSASRSSLAPETARSSPLGVEAALEGWDEPPVREGSPLETRLLMRAAAERCCFSWKQEQAVQRRLLLLETRASCCKAAASPGNKSKNLKGRCFFWEQGQGRCFNWSKGQAGARQ